MNLGDQEFIHLKVRPLLLGLDLGGWPMEGVDQGA